MWEWERCEAEVCIVTGGSAKASPPIGPASGPEPPQQRAGLERSTGLCRAPGASGVAPSRLLRKQYSRRLAVLLSGGIVTSTWEYRDRLGRSSKQSGTIPTCVYMLATPVVHANVSHPKAWHAAVSRPQLDETAWIVSVHCMNSSSARSSAAQLSFKPRHTQDPDTALVPMCTILIRTTWLENTNVTAR